MREVIGDDVWRQRYPPVDQHVLRHERGQFRALLPDQPEREIQMPHRRASGHNRSRRDELRSWSSRTLR